MRVILYNIAYGTGAPKSMYGNLSTFHRYLRADLAHLDRIAKFIEKKDPDLVCLIEVDTGSYRTRNLNQVEYLAEHLKHYCHSSVKYGENGIAKMMPILRKQANAILTRRKVPERNIHFLPVGFKRLIIELEFEGVRFFLVHLALNARVRSRQIRHIIDIAGGKDGPMIIAGDFNAFKGEHEVQLLKDALGLVNPNKKGLPTYPSWNPKRQIDFFLCSRSLKILNFEIPDVKFSDHMPLLLDVQN